MVKKGDICEGIVERIDYPDRGRITGPEGEPITVKNVIPGQKIRYKIYKKKGGRFFGMRLEVLERAQVELPASCSVFGECGGCVYQTLPYEKQLDIKEEQIKGLFDDVVSSDTIYDGIIPSPKASGYRNKMEFSFGDEYQGGPLTLGLHRRGTKYDVLDASECMLVHPDVNKVTKCVIDYCREQGFEPYHKTRHEGFLRHLLVRRAEGTGEMLICLVTSSQVKHDFSELSERILKLHLEGNIIGIIHGINDDFADMVRLDSQEILFGRDHFYEVLSGLKFKVSMFSFFQTNSLGAEKLYEKVREYITPAKEGKFPLVYDLYCGTGTIGQMLSSAAEKVVGIELVEEAVEAAKENAGFNGITNCEFIAGDVGKVLSELPGTPDYVILDPPREGIKPKTLNMIKNFDIKEMVYVSCKASSFVKDMAILRSSGWKMSRYCLVDMFPMTPHVETVVLMSRVQK